MNEKDFEILVKSPYTKRAIISKLQNLGVIFVDPNNAYIGPDVEIGAGTIIWPNIVLLGKTIIGKNCEIEEGVRLEDTEIGDDTKIHTGSRISKTRIGKKCQIWGARMYHSLLKDRVIVHCPNRVVWSEIGTGCDIDSYCLIKYAKISSRCAIGPHAIIEGEKLDEEILATGKRSIRIGRLCNIGAQTHIHERAIIKPGAELAHCEIVRSAIGENTKIKHCSYIGDVRMGRDANIGAGTVFGNYDGKEKHECEVGDGAFVGINCSIISKSTRKIGDEAFVAAYTLVTRGVEPNNAIKRPVRSQELIAWSERNENGWDLIQSLPGKKPKPKYKTPS